MNMTRAAILLLTLPLLAGCEPQLDADGRPMPRRSEFFGNPWSVQCVPVPGLPDADAHSCRAELQLGERFSPIRASLFHLPGDGRWVLRSEMPVRIFAVRLAGSNTTYTGQCTGNPVICSIDEQSGAALTAAMRQYNRVAVTVQGPNGSHITQSSPTEGFLSVYYSARARSTQGVPVAAALAAHLPAPPPAAAVPAAPPAEAAVPRGPSASESTSAPASGRLTGRRTNF